VTVKVVEDSANTVHLVLPAAEKALNDKDLSKVSGGAAQPACCSSTSADGILVSVHQ
jgi:bacteriocin-like protein